MRSTNRLLMRWKHYDNSGERPILINSSDLRMRANNWFEQADQALVRAAARARALAASTNTPIHIMKDGKIVEIRPEMEQRRTAELSSSVRIPPPLWESEAVGRPTKFSSRELHLGHVLQLAADGAEAVGWEMLAAAHFEASGSIAPLVGILLNARPMRSFLIRWKEAT